MHKEIDKIRQKVATSPWPKYIKSVRVQGFRGWEGEEIRFPFPVTVITGENGSGKSTVLKAVASAYIQSDSDKENFYPSSFFPDTPWEVISGAELSYTINEGSNTKTFSIKKKEKRWRFPDNRPKRNIILQDVSRTLPLDATVGYAKIANRNAKENASDILDSNLTTFYSSIMGKKYDSAKFSTSTHDEQRQVGVVNTLGCQYSQFHQGAGEDATLDLLKLFHDIPDTSLVLIDEVEASLHPRSQRRLVHFLLWLARTKNIQIILTTHSPYILEELPMEARIFIERTSTSIDVSYGVTSNFALNRMDDIDKPEIFIFVEDDEAEVLARTMLKQSDFDIGRISISPVGPANIVKAIGIASHSKRLPIPALGVLDADQEIQNGCVKFPGESAPEKQIFSDIYNSGLSSFSARLELSEDSLKDALEKCFTVVEHHEWPSFLARKLGQTKDYLWETACIAWCKNCIPDEELTNLKREVESRINT
ncbi:MAG: ATP-binding protein [Gammaproteobacteria bacterium]|nr:ATP-binding protein [Gammaproteobacteria bacterium]